MEIIGEKSANGYKCHLKYLPYSYFTRDSQRRVKGKYEKTLFTNKLSYDF